MAWNDITAEGRGWTEYRLEIEGYDYGFVTNRAMAKMSGGVQYLNGLKREGLRISHEANLDDFTLQGSSMTFAIVDLGEQATAAFMRAPTFDTRLKKSLSQHDSNLYLLSQEGIQIGDLLFIGTEAVKVTSVLSDRLLIIRQQLNSEPKAHPISTEWGNSLSPIVSDVPLMLENRRVRLFAYGNGDDLQGSGTQIWKGILHANPKLHERGMWKLSAYPISEVFKSELAGGLGNLKFRGIYHPPLQKLHIRLYQLANLDENWNELEVDMQSRANKIDQAVGQIDVVVSGYHPNRSALLGDLNAKLQTAANDEGWSAEMIPQFIFLEDGTLALSVYHFDHPTTGSVIAKTLNGMPGDGTWMHEERFDNTGWFPVENASVIDLRDRTMQIYTRPGNYYIQPVAQVSAPYPASLSYGNRIYLDTSVLPGTADGSLLTLKVGDDDDARRYPITRYSINSTERYVEVGGPASTRELLNRTVLKNEEISIDFGLKIATEGNLKDFLSELARLAGIYSNQGVIPFISENDLDLSVAAETILVSSLDQYQSKRDYVFYDSDMTIEEIIAEECKLINCIPSITADGRFTIRPLAFGSRTSEAVEIISHDRILTDRGMPSYDESENRVRNVGVLKTDYDVEEGEHTGEVVAIYQDSLSLMNGKKRKFEIAPVSLPTIDLLMDDIESILIRPLVILGYPLPLVEVDVPITCFNITIGDQVRLSSLHLPNRLLRRMGVRDIGAKVIGVEWDLDTGRGKLKLISSDLVYDGYSPSGRILFGEETGDDEYSLYIDRREYAPGTSSDGDYFQVDEIIHVLEGNKWEPDGFYGKIYQIQHIDATKTEIAISALTTVPAGMKSAGFAECVIRYAPMYAVENQGTDHQLEFCWINSEMGKQRQFGP